MLVTDWRVEFASVIIRLRRACMFLWISICMSADSPSTLCINTSMGISGCLNVISFSRSRARVYSSWPSITKIIAALLMVGFEDLGFRMSDWMRDNDASSVRSDALLDGFAAICVDLFMAECKFSRVDPAAIIVWIMSGSLDSLGVSTMQKSSIASTVRGWIVASKNSVSLAEIPSKTTERIDVFPHRPSPISKSFIVKIGFKNSFIIVKIGFKNSFIPASLLNSTINLHRCLRITMNR